VFGLEMDQVMAYMLLADYDHIYQMFEEKMIDGKKWNMLEHFMRSRMKSSKSIRTIWSSEDRSARSPGFEDYMETCVYSLYSPAMNPGIDGAKETASSLAGSPSKSGSTFEDTIVRNDSPGFSGAPSSCLGEARGMVRTAVHSLSRAHAARVQEVSSKRRTWTSLHLSAIQKHMYITRFQRSPWALVKVHADQDRRRSHA
jgi:hypothetical protein